MFPEEDFRTELQRQRDKFIKALQQGEQIEKLQLAPEWEFFSNWIIATKDKLNRRITGEGFINDHNGYLFTLGAVRAIDTILDGVKQFENAYNVASKRISEVNKQLDTIQ